jgi:hypothetical protein
MKTWLLLIGAFLLYIGATGKYRQVIKAAQS